MKYDLRKIMLRAWKNYRKFSNLAFGECLHRAWISAKAEETNEKRIEAAKMAVGILEETNTWSGWKQSGYEVVHGSKTIFLYAGIRCGSFYTWLYSRKTCRACQKKAGGL